MTNVSSADDYTYDANGNTVGVWGLFIYEYDDENRLTAIELPEDWRSEFVYDGLGRLRSRTEKTTWFPEESVFADSLVTYFIYDGHRVVQERVAPNSPTVSYTRGIDLSGSLEGAGGIGGLLARSDGHSSGNWTTHSFYHADGNGNITYMVDSSQSMVASYRYDPFGKEISTSGTLAGANAYRFSSKEIHSKSGLYYYLYRFYDPNVQRWISRDPMNESGHKLIRREIRPLKIEEELGLYRFVSNEPMSGLDLLGLGHNFGKCCNQSGKDEWALVSGHWKLLKKGECSGIFADCDGMTCGGGFYWVEGFHEGSCKTPGKDSPKCGPKRWTPTNPGPNAEPPVWDPTIQKGRGSKEGNTPRGYIYDLL